MTGGARDGVPVLEAFDHDLHLLGAEHSLELAAYLPSHVQTERIEDLVFLGRGGGAQRRAGRGTSQPR